jgi:hypothetical protein
LGKKGKRDCFEDCLEDCFEECLEECWGIITSDYSGMKNLSILDGRDE